MMHHSENNSKSYQNMEKLSNNLQNVKLDSTSNVSTYFEVDSKKQPPSLTNYFGNVSEQQSNKLQFVDFDSTQKNKNKPTSSTTESQTSEIKQNEPIVCRIFAETTSASKVTTDPTSNFFDSIMQSQSYNNNLNVISNIDLESYNIEETSFNDVSFGGSEFNRRRDAWIPSEETCKILITSATAPPGTYVPQANNLTMPGVLVEEDLKDMLHEVATHYLGATEAIQRNHLSADDVTQDDRGLRELIQESCYRAAINLTSRLLKIYGQGSGGLHRPSKHTPHSLQLWFTRIALLVKIKLFSIAEREAEAFGNLDNPDLYFQFYPDKFGGRPGSIVPFSFRILLSELPMHCLKPRESMLKLNKMLSTVRQILTNLRQGFTEDGNPMQLSETDRNESIKLWTGREMRVQHSIINCALQQENFSLAVELTKNLLQKDHLQVNQKIGLLSTLGRILLQVGDINGADKQLKEAQLLSEKSSLDNKYVLIDKSLIEIAKNNFTDAYHILSKVNQLDPTNILVLNNMAVCLLYTGRLKDGISLLEKAISAKPTKGLTDSLLLNLCTLYELESSHSNIKKLNLLRQLAQHKADTGMNIQQCLKLSNVV